MTERHSVAASRHRVLARGRSPNPRVASAADVLTIRGDVAMRKKARQMLRVAQEILRRTPTIAENARRLGLSRDVVRRIAHWQTYKEVR